jgi:oligopeptide transport system substrate-binding protein
VNLVFNTSEQNRVITEALQQRWKETLGVEVTIENRDWKSLLAARRSGDYGLARGGWIGAFNDALSFSEILVTNDANNQGAWSSPRYDRLVTAAATEVDPVKRGQLYSEAQRVIIEEMPVLLLYYSVRNYAISPRVEGWWPSVLDRHPWKWIRLRDHP